MGDAINRQTYEINIALWDARRDRQTEPKMTFSSTDLFVRMQYYSHLRVFQRSTFTAFWQNDHSRVENTGNLRSINRHGWDYDELQLNLQISPTIAGIGEAP